MPQRAGQRAGEAAAREPARSAPSFDAARRTLHELLAPLCFVRVISVSQAARGSAVPLHSSGTTFFGEGEEVKASHTQRDRAAPRRVFFSSFSRQNGLGMSVGGMCTLVDSPLGNDHPSSMPQMGAILVGALVASSKSKARCPFELRGWCNNARPLMELHRIVQFGTRGGESETRMLVRQAAAETAAEYLRALQGSAAGASTLSGHQKRICEAAAEVADELDCLARTVLYGSLECLLVTPPPRLGGKTPLQFVENVALVLRDSRLLHEYLQRAPPPPPPAPQSHDMSYSASVRQDGYPAYDYVAAAIRSNSYAYAPTGPLGQGHLHVQAGGGATPPYAPRSPSYMPTSPPMETGPRTPLYGGTSPAYQPQSPAYQPQSPAYQPQSPAYQPQSPAYKPQSPAYTPASPPSQTQPQPQTQAQLPYQPVSPPLPPRALAGLPPPPPPPLLPPTHGLVPSSPPYVPQSPRRTRSTHKAAASSPESGEDDSGAASLLRRAIRSASSVQVKDSDL